MKLFINHSDNDRVKDIVEKLVNAAGRSVLINKPDIDKRIVDQVVKAVKSVMSETMDTLLLGSTSTVVEFDIENAVSQAFENVAKLAEWKKVDDENATEEKD